LDIVEFIYVNEQDHRKGCGKGPVNHKCTSGCYIFSDIIILKHCNDIISEASSQGDKAPLLSENSKQTEEKAHPIMCCNHEIYLICGDILPSTKQLIDSS
jgi:hypothetical protein